MKEYTSIQIANIVRQMDGTVKPTKGHMPPASGAHVTEIGKELGLGVVRYDPKYVCDLGTTYFTEDEVDKILEAIFPSSF